MPRVNQRGPRPLELAWSADIGDCGLSLSFRADGRELAIASASGEICIFETVHGKLVSKVDAHPGGALGVAFAPKGERLASVGQDGSLCIHNSSEPGRELIRVMRGRGWTEQLAWSHDGARLAVSAGKRVTVFDSNDLRDQAPPLYEWTDHASAVTGLAFDPRNSLRLAAASYGGVKLWSLIAGELERALVWKGSMISLSWSPDGAYIACGCQDQSVHFWRLASGADSEMSGYAAKPKAIAWCWDSSLLATSGDATATLWDFAGRGPEGTEPIILHGHVDHVSALSFAPKAVSLATGGHDGRVVFWQPRRSTSPIAAGELGPDGVETLRWSPTQMSVAAVDKLGRVALLR